jgi:hypothetical protein
MKNLFFAALLFVLAACGSSASDHDPELIGTWLWTADGAYAYTFNYDGTGERGFYETNQTFTWATNGDRLEITRNNARRNEIENETWTFEYEDYTLHMNSNNRNNVYFTYTRAPEETDGSLLGRWAWNADPTFLYTFFMDGTGTRGREGMT